MSAITRILVLILAIGLGMIYKNVSEIWSNVPAPQLDATQWWGDGQKPSDYDAYLANNSAIIGNRLNYQESRIETLREELNRTLRLTAPLEGVNFEYGFNTHYLQELIAYWRDDYLPRWREREVFLWQFNHFTTDIQGLRMHFLHLMAYEENIVGKQHYPVLLLHGWPGSVREFYALIRKLHDIESNDNNQYVFNVIVPSLPGFGWSQGTSKPGMGPAQVAVIMRNLMLRLGYQKFFIQGGDWGSIIGSHMATLYPQHVLGYHSNMCASFSPKSLFKGWFASLLPHLFAPTEFQDIFVPRANALSYLIEESGYFHLQATKPDTIGAALTANPIGLAAYILEKFSTWTNPKYRQLADGGLTKRYDLDALLDNIMIYYLTNSITTSQRIYAEAYTKSQLALQLDRVLTSVPTACAHFKSDIMHFTDFQLRDKYTNLLQSTYYSEGGHFAALELPDVLYRDFIEFVKKVVKREQSSRHV